MKSKLGNRVAKLSGYFQLGVSVLILGFIAYILWQYQQSFETTLILLLIVGIWIANMGTDTLRETREDERRLKDANSKSGKKV